MIVETPPLKRLPVILASAVLSRQGTHFELPISFGLFLAIGVVPWVFGAFVGPLPLRYFVNFIILQIQRRLMHVDLVILELYSVFAALRKSVSVAISPGFFNGRHCC